VAKRRGLTKVKAQLRRRAKAQVRDAFGRFVKQGQTPAAPPRRNAAGKFISKEDYAAHDAEALKRVQDIAFLTPQQFAERRQRELRQAEVKREKAERYKRARNARSKYKHKSRPDGKTLADRKRILAGEIPAPMQRLRHGQNYEYIWAWQGPNALQTAQDFLLHLQRKLPADALTYLSVGNGYSKNSLWVGTKLGTPSQTWWHSQTFLSAQSGNTQILNKMPQTPAALELWAEVKLITRTKL
jgi:hypothetical protein